MYDLIKTDRLQLSTYLLTYLPHLNEYPKEGWHGDEQRGIRVHEEQKHNHLRYQLRHHRPRRQPREALVLLPKGYVGLESQALEEQMQHRCQHSNRQQIDGRVRYQPI